MTRGHMVVPWQERVQITPFHSIKKIQVVLDPDQAHKMSGTKERKNRKLMLSKVQLEAIAEAVGFEILDSKPLTDTPERIVWQVRGAVTEPDGKKTSIIKTYELDMRLKETDGVDGGYIILARSRARKRYDDLLSHPEWKPWDGEPAKDDEESWEKHIEAKAMADWAMTNRHRVRRAETGAALACIRSKCRIKSIYEEAEFQQPWVVYRTEFDVERAIQYGGKIGEFAMRGIGISMTQSLGLPESMVAGLLESIGASEDETGGNGDLLNASEEEIDELEAAMVGVGFKDRSQCDSRTLEIFDLPLSQLTRRHVRLMQEYVELGSAALAVKLESEEMAEFTNALIDAARLAYASGARIEEFIEEDWLAKIYPTVEEEAEEEDAGATGDVDDEEESEESTEDETGEEPEKEEAEETTEDGDEETTEKEAGKEEEEAE